MTEMHQISDFRQPRWIKIILQWFTWSLTSPNACVGGSLMLLFYCSTVRTDQFNILGFLTLLDTLKLLGFV